MVDWEILLQPYSDLIGRINQEHLDYIRKLLDEKSFQEGSYISDIPDLAYKHNFKREYTALLITIIQHVTPDDLSQGVEDFDGFNIDHFHDHRWMLLHLLDLLLLKIENFYDEYPIPGFHTIITSSLTGASYRSYQEVKKYLNPTALDKFFSDLAKDLLQHPVEPILPLRRYSHLRIIPWHEWYAKNFPKIQGPTGAVGPTGSPGGCRPCIIEDREFLSNLYINPDTTKIPDDQAYPGDMSFEEHEEACRILGISRSVTSV